MRLVEFFTAFIDLFRSRYVRYLEKEVVRLRQENAGLNSTLLSTKGIQQIATPDMQDLSARGQKLRNEVMGERAGPRNVVKRGNHATLRRDLEDQSRSKAAAIEREIASRREEKEKVNAAQ